MQYFVGDSYEKETITEGYRQTDIKREWLFETRVHIGARTHTYTNRAHIWLCVYIYIYVHTYIVGQDSVAGIVTLYGLVGPGIKSQGFPHPSRLALGPTQPPLQWVPDLSGSKVVGAWHWPPTPSSAEVKERVQFYLYSPFGPIWSVLGRSLHFYTYTLLAGRYAYIEIKAGSTLRRYLVT
jgi:hypothetical protein